MAEWTAHVHPSEASILKSMAQQIHPLPETHQKCFLTHCHLCLHSSEKLGAWVTGLVPLSQTLSLFPFSKA